MARPIRLDLDLEHLTLGPGETARLGLTLRNTSDVVEHLHVEVRGLPPGGRATSEPRTVKLLPSAVAESTVTIELPATPLPAAGEHVLGVLAHSPHRREVSRCEEVRLQVPAQEALTLDVEPELVRAGARARYLATLSNDGNVPLVVALRGVDPEREVGLRTVPDQVTVAPGRTAHVQATAVAPRPWTGQDKRRTLTITAAAGATTASRSVAFVQPPRLRPVALRSLAAVLGLSGVAAAIVLSGRLANSGGADPTPPPAPEQSSTQAPPTSAEPSASPEPSAPPTSGPPSPEPSATTSPSAAPSPSPTPSATPVAPVLVPFTDGGGGAASRVVDGTRLWAAEGVVVAAAAGAGPTVAGCEDADAVALHTLGATTFVTAAKPTQPTECNSVGVQVSFTGPRAPATGVVLEVVEDGDYVLLVEGRPPQPVRDAALFVTLEPDESVTSVVLAANPEGEAPPDRVGLTRVRFVPRG